MAETFTAIDGYDKKTVHTLRRCTLDDIRAMRTDWGREYLFIDLKGQVRRCRPNGRLQEWKRDPERFERGFKYGMYETWRMTTQDMLDRLVFEVKS